MSDHHSAAESFGMAAAQAVAADDYRGAKALLERAAEAWKTTDVGWPRERQAAEALRAVALWELGHLLAAQQTLEALNGTMSADADGEERMAWETPLLADAPREAWLKLEVGVRLETFHRPWGALKWDIQETLAFL